MDSSGWNFEVSEVKPNYSYMFDFEAHFTHQKTRIWMQQNWTYVFWWVWLSSRLSSSSWLTRVWCIETGTRASTCWLFSADSSSWPTDQGEQRLSFIVDKNEREHECKKRAKHKSIISSHIRNWVCKQNHARLALRNSVRNKTTPKTFPIRECFVSRVLTDRTMR